MKTESDLEKHCVKLAAHEDYFLWKWESPGKRGVPDRILLKPNEIIFVEFKNPNGKGKLRPDQVRRIRDIRALGHRVEVIDSVEDFEKLL